MSLGWHETVRRGCHHLLQHDATRGADRDAHCFHTSEEQQRTSIPQMTMPGTTSRVLLTTASSAVFMSRAAMPGMPVFTMPSFCNLFTPAAAQDASDAKSLWACILDTNGHQKQARALAADKGEALRQGIPI